MRLYILVEGPTEEAFVKTVLYPHLASHGVWATPIVVETKREPNGSKKRGGGSWSKWLDDLRRLTGKNRSGARFTTMFDLYRLPKDFPELACHAREPNAGRRAELLEQAMAAAVEDHRLLPYLQVHEFEALVLAALEQLASCLDSDEQRSGVNALAAEIADLPPESVNDGPETAPSKRLDRHIPGYRKIVHGPLALEGAGLPTLMSACPRFADWVRRLETLAR